MADPRQLQLLVDARRFDELLRQVSSAEVAATWMRYQHKDIGPTMEPESDPDWWAVEAWMDEMWWSDENRVRTGILELVAAADTDDDFGVLGAAVMEVFVRSDADRIAWLEHEAAGSESFRKSLHNVYVWGYAPDDVAQRVEDAAGVPLPRPKPIADAATRQEVRMLRQTMERLRDSFQGLATDLE